MYLYDKVYGRQTHRAVQNFLAYAKKNYMGVAKDGKLEWITSYYDPIANHKSNAGAGAGIAIAFMALPQDRELATVIYEAAANPRVPARASSTALLMARELGDHTAVARLSAAAEREYEPRFFGEHDEKFGWWFHLNEGYPRGQQSATMMVSEVGNGGDWLRAFEAPHMSKFKAPTVEGIDFPALGVYQAWNDVASGTLYVGTYAASPDRQGAETSWRVTNLPNTGDVVVLCDGEPFKRFAVTGPNTIRIDTTIDNRRYEIFTGYRGAAKPANQAQQPARTERLAAAVGAAQPTSAAGADAVNRASFFPAGGPGCPCCQA
jgi:hypothetical protein